MNTAPSVKLTQSGTGLHLDSWPYNLWQKLNKDMTTYDPLDRFRPFQSFVALTDGSERRELEEGGLEIVPGFASVAEKYFPAMDVKLREGKSKRIKQSWVSSYHIGFDQPEDEPLKQLVRKVQRIPSEWMAPPAEEVLTEDLDADQCLEHMKRMVSEVDQMEYVPIRKGDFVFFDMRTAHQNSNANKMDRPRAVVYHAYAVAHQVNKENIDSLKEKRKTFEHPSDFNKKFKMEQQVLDKNNDVVPLTKLGSCLFNEEDYESLLTAGGEIETILNTYGPLLTQRHIDFFVRYGYVVVENLVDDADCDELMRQLSHYSNLVGCPLETTEELLKSEWRKIGGNFGAMVEFYWLPMQQQIRMNEKLYAVTSKLLENTWCSKTPNHWHVPFTCPFIDEVDSRKLWLYIDRMNYRLPELQ